MENNTYPAIILFTFNRLDEFKETFDNLKNNYLFDKFQIYIFNDGSRNKNDEKEVFLVRDYLLALDKEFENIVELIFRNENFGLSKSIIEGVDYVLNRHNEVIVIEDDIVTNKYFLDFMMKSLLYYKTNKDVFTISGFSFSLKSIPKNYQFSTFMSLRPFPWGWAIWKDRWDNIEWNKLELLTKWNNDNSNNFNRGGDDLIPMLKNEFKGKINSWDVLLMFNQYLMNMYSVFPIKSYTHNIGWGENSTHNKGFNHYEPILVSNEDHDNLTFCDSENQQIINSFSYHFSKKNKIISRLKYIKSWRKFVAIFNDLIIVLKRKFL